ncbi:MAG: hypothetical protein ACP5TL_02745 [Candidatus Micrarchaeia archaeon]
MIGKEAAEKRVAMIDEIVEVLEKRKGLGELTYEQQLTLDHSKKLIEDKQKIARIKKELSGIDALKEECVAKILEIMPSNQMLLKQILAGCRATLDEETINKIVTMIKGKV